MKKKSITLVLGGVILCTTIVISTLFLNSPHSSHAASRLSTATNLQSSPNASPTNGILSGNVFYGSNGSSVYALNATTGVPIWKYHLKGYATAWLLGLHHGIVYISLSNGPQGVVYSLFAALQATNGSLVWLSSQAIYAPLGLVDSFQVVNGHIYFMASAGGYCCTLYAFNANGGSYLWSSSAEGMVISQGSIYTYDDAPFGGPPNPKICALNANDGSVRWCYHDASIVGYNDPMLLYVNGIVYANSYSSFGPYAIALNANDGSLLWSVAGMKIASVVQNIAFATNQNDTEALNASNGSLLVQYQNASYLFSHNGVVYAIDSSNDLVAFRQSDGSLLWHYNFLGLGQACLPPMNGVLYCLSNDLKTEFALNATNGTLLWKYSLGSVDVSPPCPYAFNNVLYCIGNGNQTLFAFNATSGTLLWKHGLSECPNISSGCLDLSPGLLTSLNGITYVLTGIDTNDIFVVHVHAYNAMNGTLLWKY